MAIQWRVRPRSLVCSRAASSRTLCRCWRAWKGLASLTGNFSRQSSSAIWISLPVSQKWENLEGGGKIPLGEILPGSGFENCTFNWDHADVVHARFHPYVSKNMAWLLKWHSI